MNAAFRTPPHNLEDGQASHVDPRNWLPPLTRLLEEVADMHDVTPAQMRGPQRRKELVMARRDFCRRAYDSGHWSSTQIGRVINRDHTTVLYSAGRLKKRGDEA